MIAATWVRARRSPARWSLPLLVPAGLWVLLQLVSPVPYWDELGGVAIYSTIVLAPTAAAFAGLRAWSERRVTVRELRATDVRDRAVTAVPEVLGEAFWPLVAYSIGVAVLVVRTAQEATWGGPPVGRLAAGAAIVLAAAALGWAAGTLLPSPLTGPLVGLAIYVFSFVVYPYEVSLLSWLLPTGWVEHSPWTPLPAWIGWTQASWFLGLAVTAVAAVALARRRAAPTVALTVAGAFAVAAASAGLAVAGPVEVDVELVCDRSAPVEVCLHPARVGDGRLVAAIREVLQPLTDAGVGPDRVVDVRGTAADVTGPVTDDWRLTWDGGPELGLRPGFDPDGAVLSVVDVVMPLSWWEDDDCSGGDGGHDGGDADGPDATQEVLRVWLQERAGVRWRGWIQHADGRREEEPRFPYETWEAAFVAFDALPAADRDAWLADQFAAVRACEVSLDELPGAGP